MRPAANIEMSRSARWYSIFKPKITILGTFWRAFKNYIGVFYGHLEYFKATWYILCPFANFLVILYIFARLGQLFKEKSGNP
jgi:hypothetical protein